MGPATPPAWTLTTRANHSSAHTPQGISRGQPTSWSSGPRGPLAMKFGSNVSLARCGAEQQFGNGWDRAPVGEALNSILKDGESHAGLSSTPLALNDASTVRTNHQPNNREVSCARAGRSCANRCCSSCSSRERSTSCSLNRSTARFSCSLCSLSSASLLFRDTKPKRSCCSA